MLKKIEQIKTDDGSFTLKNNIFDETYHSIFGAMSESLHVFIDAGYKYIDKKQINIFEIGFGSGLNAFLTFKQTFKDNKKINYIAIEKYPIEKSDISKFAENIKAEKERLLFLKIHSTKWNTKTKITTNFALKKISEDFIEYNFTDKYDLVYFDAFSFDTQPEMWTKKIFEKLYSAMNQGGILVTYSSKGTVKENLRAAGFLVKRLKGFKKRHMLRAIKN